LVKFPPELQTQEITVYGTTANPEIDRQKFIHFGLGYFWKASVHPWGREHAESLIDLGNGSECLRKYLLGQGDFPQNMALVVFVMPKPVSLLKNADLALYQAKATGRSCFLYFLPEMEIRAQEKRELELALRKAVPLRQLELHYRPQVDIETKRLVGLEAMLRWRHPSQGILNPAAFIPIAEEIGIVVPIGEWVLKAACQEASHWPDDVTVAISVSPLQFETKRFFEAVKHALEVTGITGRRLEIAVTESILLRDGNSVLAILNKLRSIGVKVAIDSFGTGIASLSQMVEFPLDKIKIDGTLIEENGSDRQGRTRRDCGRCH
jgi:predicted signal transduction protein with EAL and GGDEF domain